MPRTRPRQSNRGRSASGRSARLSVDAGAQAGNGGRPLRRSSWVRTTRPVTPPPPRRDCPPRRRENALQNWSAAEHAPRAPSRHILEPLLAARSTHPAPTGPRPALPRSNTRPAQRARRLLFACFPRASCNRFGGQQRLVDCPRPDRRGGTEYRRRVRCESIYTRLAADRWSVVSTARTGRCRRARRQEETWTVGHNVRCTAISSSRTPLEHHRAPRPWRLRYRTPSSVGWTMRRTQWTTYCRRARGTVSWADEMHTGPRVRRVYRKTRDARRRTRRIARLTLNTADRSAFFSILSVGPAQPSNLLRQQHLRRRRAQLAVCPACMAVQRVLAALPRAE